MVFQLLAPLVMAFKAYHCDTTKSPLGIRTHCVEKSKFTKKMISSWRDLNGKADGVAEGWYDDGRKKFRHIYRQGQFIDTSYWYFQDGSTSRIIRCSPSGEACSDTMWHSNRRVARTGFIFRGKDTGEIRSYGPNGGLVSLETYNDLGQRHGVHAFWSSKSILRDSTVFKDGLVMARYNRDTTTGRWQSWWIYDSDGQTLKSAEGFDPNGKSAGRVVNGTGSVVFYNKKGVAIGRDTYKDGILIKDETFGD